MQPMTPDSNERPTRQSRAVSFRRAILRGLGVVLPPLLTIVVLIWAWHTIESYILRPMEAGVRHAIVWSVQVTYSEIPKDATVTGYEMPYDLQTDDPIILKSQHVDRFTYRGTRFVRAAPNRRFIPVQVKKTVDGKTDYFQTDDAPAPTSANAYWHRYVQMIFMPRSVVVPVFLAVFATVLYFLGRLFTVGLGRWFVHGFDRGISRIPLVNKVYGSVKQVTDFAFSDREIEFNRVVAIQYPSKGIWSLGFVTGNSLSEISQATGEPMLSVLMPTSPMPMTGFTVTVKKSEAIDLNLTVDEAIQFVVSCGVVVPPQQRVDQTIEVVVRTGIKPPTLAARGEETSGPAAPVQA
jgi:uncharacterized membrane protein